MVPPVCGAAEAVLLHLVFDSCYIVFLFCCLTGVLSFYYVGVASTLSGKFVHWYSHNSQNNYFLAAHSLILIYVISDLVSAELVLYKQLVHHTLEPNNPWIPIWFDGDDAVGCLFVFCLPTHHLSPCCAQQH